MILKSKKRLGFLDLWLKFCGGPNQKSTMIGICEIHIYFVSDSFDEFVEKCRRSRLLFGNEQQNISREPVL